MIVGLDPGTTVGVVILDTKGNILDIKNMREARKSDLIKHILNFGKPVIIASDVNPLPKMIKRLAAALGSRVYYPEVSLTNLEKEKIAGEFKEKVKNSHQKDALAAAWKAFKNYHQLLLKIEETLAKQDKENIFEEVVRDILEEEDQSIIDTIKKVSKRKRR